MFWQRVASAAVAAPILAVAVWLGGPVFLLLILAVALLASLEFFSLVRKAGFSPLTLLGAIMALFFVGNAYLEQQYTAPLLVATLLVPLVWLLWRPQFSGAVSDWAITVTGVLYSGWLISYFVALRGMPQGLSWTVLATLATFACDTGAFAAGKLWGRHKLIPRVSPGKTVEGSIGGLFCAILATVVLAAAFSLPINTVAALGLGVTLGLLTQVGDLAESMIKRSLQVKDASTLIPGHGGILDRVDSLGFAVVVVFYWATWVNA